MEATPRPYDRGEEVTPFATLGRAREPTRSLAGSLSPPRMAGFGYCAPGAKNPDGRGPFHVEPGVGDVAPFLGGASS